MTYIDGFVIPVPAGKKGVSLAGALRLVLVVATSRDELGFGFGVELDASHRSLERAFSKTWSAATPDTFPDSKSASLRSASCRQSFSASESVS
jgi:hypothetical protein